MTSSVHPRPLWGAKFFCAGRRRCTASRKNSLSTLQGLHLIQRWEDKRLSIFLSGQILVRLRVTLEGVGFRIESHGMSHAPRGVAEVAEHARRMPDGLQISIGFLS